MSRVNAIFYIVINTHNRQMTIRLEMTIVKTYIAIFGR